MNIPTICTISCLLAFGLAACQEEAPPQTTAAGGQAATASRDATAPVVPTLMSVRPSRLEACDPPAEVSVTWDTTQQRPEIKIVEIWVAESASTEPKLFTASMSVGEIKTAAWMRPGSVVILKAQGSAAELERIVIDGPVCAG